MPRGHFNHKGRPGKLGGSLPKGATNLGKLFQVLKGSSRSGNFGHEGRPGKRGGSVSNLRSLIASKMVTFDEGKEYPTRDKDIDMITEFAKGHPQELIEKLGHIYIAYGNEELQDAAYLREDLSSSDLNEIDIAGGVYFRNSKSIGVTTGWLPKEQIRDTFDHEVGHLLWNQTSEGAKDGYAVHYNMIPDFGRKTEYSKTNYEESFCETYNKFLREPSSLTNVEKDRIGYVLDDAGYYDFGERNYQ